jgi:N-acetyltransferase
MTQPMQVVPVTLSGEQVRLEPLATRHLSDLTRAAAFEEVWTYLDEPTPTGNEPIAQMISEALEEQDQGQRIPFAVIDKGSGKAIGTVSYIDIQRTHRAVEIGWAWLTPSYWRTGAARESAYLLMRHAFEELGAIRVAFKTDSRNERSQRAIAGLGATREGMFRNHRVLRDGYIRHSIYYSVTADEWPRVRESLERRAKHASGEAAPD